MLGLLNYLYMIKLLKVTDPIHYGALFWMVLKQLMVENKRRENVALYA